MRRLKMRIISVLLVLSMLLSACGTGYIDAQADETSAASSEAVQDDVPEDGMASEDVSKDGTVPEDGENGTVPEDGIASEDREASTEGGSLVLLPEEVEPDGAAAMTDEISMDEVLEDDGIMLFSEEAMLSEPAYLMSASAFSGSSRETRLDGQKTLFIDKYVDTVANSSIPNQFTLTIEAGVEDGEMGVITLEPAPEERFTAFLIDQSYEELSNSRLDSVNQCLETYFESMRAENAARMERAKNGLYSDIDPDGNVDAQMTNHLLKVILVVGYNQEAATRWKNFDGYAPLTDAHVSYLLSNSKIKSQTFTDPYDYDAIKAGKLYNDNRAGSAMIYTYDELTDLTQYKKDRTNLVILTDWNFHDFKANKEYNNVLLNIYNSNTAIYPDPRSGSNIFSLAYNTNMYIFGMMGGDAGEMAVGSDGNVNAVNPRDFQHITWSMNQANFLLDYARKTKDMGITINSVIVNDIWQKDITDTAFETGRIEDLNGDWYGGIISIMASAVSSDYPRNSHFGSVLSWFDHSNTAVNSEFAPVNGAGGGFVDWVGFDSVYDFFDLPYNVDNRFDTLESCLRRFRQYTDAGSQGEFRMYYDIWRDYWRNSYNDKRWNFFYYEPGLEPNRFGIYSKYPEDINECIPAMTEIVKQIGGGKLDGGYATSSSAIQDVLSGPFSLPGGTADIKVYKVPRIPADLNAAGVPASKGSDGRSSSFRWGRKSYEGEATSEGVQVLSEWTDITSSVSVSVNGKSIRISGFDYESNAITDYNKRGADVYQDGDYGYKLVALISITADDTFGGNSIRTNVPDNSGFLPSLPGSESDLPKWTENGSLNPSGDTFVDKFPLPKVDLQPTHPYTMITQDVYVYAPQTAPAVNLVMDNNRNIFYNDPYYDVLKINANQILDKYGDVVDELNTFIADHEGTALSDAEMLKQIELQDKATDLYAQYKEVLADMATCVLSTPDGKNNQFVDLFFTLNDPDGNRIGTMEVPHGKAYANGNIQWNFDAMGTDTRLTKSGTYKVTVKVTPVNTACSPNGLIYTAKDVAAMSDYEKENVLGKEAAYSYSAEGYSMTGSTASGSFKGSTQTGESHGYLYQLHVKTEDTRLTPRQTIDFNIGNESLESMNNVHIMSYEWVCTDGKTESIKANEPGNTGALNVGRGGVSMANSIPQRAYNEGRVQKIIGMTSAGDGTGFYIPVTTTLRRSCGYLDKTLSETAQVSQVTRYMSDTDNVFGTGKSSVVWEHTCEVSQNDEAEFEEAQSYGDSDDGKGTYGMVRYMIHVEQNPKPRVVKSAPTTVIARGDTLKWDVTASNDSEEENPNHLYSEFTLVDVAPFNGDERIDPMTNIEGSKIHGNVYFEGVSVDITASERTKLLYEQNKLKLLYTTDVSVRTASETQLLGESSSGNITWREATMVYNNGTISALSLPRNVTAVRFDTALSWNEKVVMNVSGNVDNVNAQVNGDRYHNEAKILNGNGIRRSNVVAIVMNPASVSGKVWYDEDVDGLLGTEESGIPNVTVTLYKEWDSKNAQNPVDRVISGVKLSKVYDKDFNALPSQVTDVSGSYIFEEINPGTYYIVADAIPDIYLPAPKQAGKNSSNASLLDSECEESFGTNTDASLDQTAWIKKVTVSGASVKNQNFGMQYVKGTVTIKKVLDEFYYPTIMTDEEKADYQLVFLFQLKNRDTGEIFKKSVRLTNKNFNKGTASCTFEDLPMGTYELTEMDEAQYTLDRFEDSGHTGNISKGSGKTWIINMTPKVHDFKLTAYNKMDKDPPGGDENGMSNLVKVRVPVKLDIIYVGDDPVGNRTLIKYDFKESDFAPSRGGDIIVTYDDGTKISLSAGTLRFSDITLSPATVTNMMNTEYGPKLLVTGFYSEKGRVVKDSFHVAVNLKPVHKFKLTFDANGSSFSDGATRNLVNFAYDDNAGYNVITGGTYKDLANGGLRQYISSAYGFAGWNTRDDGTGTNYSELSALDALGRDPSVDELTLYAQWTCSITLDPQGGKIVLEDGLTSANVTDTERNVLNKTTASTITWNLNQSVDIGLEGSKTNYNFVLWNTKPDGTGTDLDHYGNCTGPVTFYAIYYQSDYYYTGAPQTFTAPVAGTYRIQLWGASGSSFSGGGKGGEVVGSIYLSVGEKLWVYCGGLGLSDGTGGWNGGGHAGIGAYGGSGGTDIRLWNNSNISGRIMVAGGGGGVHCENHPGGAGGGLVGVSVDAADGGTQTTGYAKGQGESTSSDSCGGGGGGYWGGFALSLEGASYMGGAGGSSYASGMAGCEVHYSGRIFSDAYTNADVHSGAGEAHFLLTEIDR